MPLRKSYQQLKKCLMVNNVTTGFILGLVPDDFNLSSIFDKQGLVQKLTSLSNSDSNSLIWISPKVDNLEKLISDLNYSCAIIPDTAYEALKDQFKNLVFVKDPRYVYARVAGSLLENENRGGIDKHTKIDSRAIIADKVSIGAFSTIGNCVIGKGTIIHPNVTIYDNVEIGENVVIHSGTVIGSEGFGFVKNSEGEVYQFPHIGGVIIGNNVVIGSNTSIDRGTLDNTIIQDNAKVDNLVHVAHNVNIGKGCYIIAHTIIGGSTIIEDNAWISPNTTIRDNITIGEGALLGMGAVLTKSMPNNEIWAGNPAKFIKRI